MTLKSVTLLLLWEEYLQERPDGYSYAQFCKRYQLCCQGNKLSMRRHYRAGEVMFVDYAGMKVRIYYRATRELLFEAPIFVATLGASNRIYAEATEDATLVHWIGSHVRAFEYIGASLNM